MEGGNGLGLANFFNSYHKNFKIVNHYLTVMTVLAIFLELN